MNHSPHPGGQSLVIYPLMTSAFVHVSPHPILVSCSYLLSLLPDLGITLGLVDVLVWFGSVLLGGFYHCEWPWALSLGLCPHLQPSLQGNMAMALVLPLPPCSRHLDTSLPIWSILPCSHAMDTNQSCSLDRAALPKPGLFPVVSLQISLFSQSFSSVIWMCPHTGGICLCQQVQGLWSRCSGVATATPGLAFCLLHLLTFSWGTAQFYSISHHARPDLP